MMDKQCFDYIDQNKGRFLDELQQFLRFPSISAEAKHKDDLIRCAQWLVDHLKHLGLEARLVPTQGHPIVWARGKGQSDKKLIIYGHYDVQPVDPVSQWQSDPFTPTIRDGFLYARGASDDKGQLFAHIKGVESLLKTRGHLPCEVVFLFEGEEECGGNNLEHYIKNEKANLAADAVIVSDTSLYDEATPAITYGLRGMVAMDVKIKTAAHALHSGSYGGAVGNAVKVLSSILSQCS
ncbi:MAG: M20/M25/M40 family metallo-hydrolase, partial [Anaerohalosphaeraceae bacterium]